MRWNWFSKVWVSQTKHFLFVILLKTLESYGISWLLLLCGCIRMHKSERKLSSFKLSCNLFGVISIVDNTNGITYIDRVQLIFQVSIFSVIVLWRLWLLGIATYIKYKFLMDFSTIIMAGVFYRKCDYVSWACHNVVYEVSNTDGGSYL